MLVFCTWWSDRYQESHPKALRMTVRKLLLGKASQTLLGTFHDLQKYDKHDNIGSDQTQWFGK